MRLQKSSKDSLAEPLGCSVDTACPRYWSRTCIRVLVCLGLGWLSASCDALALQRTSSAQRQHTVGWAVATIEAGW